MRQNNCMMRAHFSLNVAAPPGSTFDFVTPLLYAPGPAEFCDSTVKVSAQMIGPDGSNSEYVSRITVLIINQALARRSQEAYQAYLANGDAAKRKEALEKAETAQGAGFLKLCGTMPPIQGAAKLMLEMSVASTNDSGWAHKWKGLAQSRRFAELRESATFWKEAAE